MNDYHNNKITYNNYELYNIYFSRFIVAKTSLTSIVSNLQLHFLNNKLKLYLYVHKTFKSASRFLR